MSFRTSKFLAPFIGAAIAAAPAAQAEILSYAGITGQLTDGINTSGEDSDLMTSLGAEAMVAYDFGNGLRLAFESIYNNNDGGNTFVSGNVGIDGEVAVFALYDVTDDVTLGAFASHGVGVSVSGNSDETYPFNAYGLQGSWFATDQIMTYLQYAHVDNPDSGTSSGGYRDGHAARLGIGYQFTENAFFVFDAQFGEADGYEDSGEDGFFRRISLGGDYMFGGSNWGVTYDFGHEVYDAIGDDNRVETSFASVGFRYYFGDTRASDIRRAGLVGTPDIMRRASLVTEGLN